MGLSIFAMSFFQISPERKFRHGYDLKCNDISMDYRFLVPVLQGLWKEVTRDHIHLKNERKRLCGGIVSYGCAWPFFLFMLRHHANMMNYILAIGRPNTPGHAEICFLNTSLCILLVRFDQDASL